MIRIIDPRMFIPSTILSRRPWGGGFKAAPRFGTIRCATLRVQEMPLRRSGGPRGSATEADARTSRSLGLNLRLVDNSLQPCAKSTASLCLCCNALNRRFLL